MCVIRFKIYISLCYSLLSDKTAAVKGVSGRERNGQEEMTELGIKGRPRASGKSIL